ncbi:hypothetical protein [Streptosporangium lutulentum]|uniref:Uncharacterized protein n=1 Tax=Streptosporangium lutulentum TaxID=1461250 RepID=A0ABT9QAH9_9ACTN|nr:hypothetical protein [Streptosporangium lutulentum]MDP9843303.1 hypothetical protein [Streptosporangium lutulentum]
MNNDQHDAPGPFSNRRKKKPRKINGKKIVKQKKTQDYPFPRHSVMWNGEVVCIVEGYGVTEQDLASARAMVLGFSHTGGM